MNRLDVIDIYGVNSINDVIIINFINYMSVLIPEDTNTILLFVKCINDILKNMPSDSKSVYMYINHVMIEFRNGVRNTNNKLSTSIDSFFLGLQFCDVNNISSVMLTLIEDFTRSLTFYELITNGITDNNISKLLFNNDNINKSFEMKFSQPQGLNIPLYMETDNPNIIKKIEIDDRFRIINEIKIPTINYMAEFAPEYTNVVSKIHNMLPKEKKCKCIRNLQNIGGLLFQVINNIISGIIFNKCQTEIIKENIKLFNKSSISRCSDCKIKSLIYDSVYMVIYLKYELPINQTHVYDYNNNIGSIRISNIDKSLQRAFTYNLKGGQNVQFRNGFHIPNGRTTIQQTGCLKLFGTSTNFKTIEQMKKDLIGIYSMTSDKHSIPLYYALIKICIIITDIIPMCLAECMDKNE